MIYRWFRKPKALACVPLLSLLFTIACVGAAPLPTSTPAPATTPAPASTPTPADTSTATPTPVPTTTTDAPAWVRQGQRGGTVPVISPLGVGVWDPHQASNAADAAGFGPMYNQLVEYNPVKTDEIVCDLCSNWQVSANSASYIFQLREATWSDGQPLTAEDVKFSLDRMVEPGQPRPNTGSLAPYINSVQIIDPQTIQVDLKIPNSTAFLKYLGVEFMKILPRHVLQSGVDINTPESAVGSGPFMFVRGSHVRGNRWDYARNPNYFKEGLPFLDRMQVFQIEDASRIMAAYETEQVLMPNAGTLAEAGFSGTDFQALEQRLQGKGTVHWGPPSVFMGIFFNPTRPPFDNPIVRRAMFLAIDRLAIMDAQLSGAGIIGTPFGGVGVSAPPAEVFQWPGYRYVDGNGNPLLDPRGRIDAVKDPRDLAEARSLLEAAGYPNGFSVDAVINPGNREGLALFAESVEPLGVRVNIRQKDTAAYLLDYASGNYVLSSVRHGMSILDVDELCNAFYMPGGVRNRQNWENLRVTELCTLQAREANPDRRRARVLEIQNIIRQGHSHWAPVFWGALVVWPVNDKIKNVHPFQTVQTGMKWEHVWLEQ